MCLSCWSAHENDADSSAPLDFGFSAALLQRRIVGLCLSLLEYIRVTTVKAVDGSLGVHYRTKQLLFVGVVRLGPSLAWQDLALQHVAAFVGRMICAVAMIRRRQHPRG